MAAPLSYAEAVTIAAPAREVYAVVSDVTRTGEWSPVCRGCWWDAGDGPRIGTFFAERFGADAPAESASYGGGMANIDPDNVRFTPVRMREGFDMGEVDAHLDLVKQTFDALDRAINAGGPMPGALPTPRFMTVRLREGYDMVEVDAFLTAVATEEARLRALAGRGITPAASPQTDPVVDPSAPAEVVDVSAPAQPYAAPDGSAYPEVIRKGSSGAGLAIVAALIALALVIAIVALL